MRAGRSSSTMTSPAVCSVLHILDGNMKKLLSRDWRGDISPACIYRFVARVWQTLCLQDTPITPTWLGEIVVRPLSTPNSASAEPYATVQDAESESELKPVMYDSDAEVSYVYITHNNLYLLAITNSNCNAAALLTFLHRLVDIFRHYFKTLEEVRLHVLASSTRHDSFLRMLYMQHIFHVAKKTLLQKRV